MRRGVNIFWIGLWTAAILTAQSPPVPPLDLRFTAYAVNRPAETFLIASRAGGEAQPIQFYTSQRSPRLDYRGPNPVIFFTEEPRESPNVPPIRRTLAEATVPPDVSQPLFIFFPNPLAAAEREDEEVLPYVAYVFDDGPVNMPAGRVILVNASGREFIGNFNDEVRPVRTGLNPPINAGRSLRIDLRTEVRGRYWQAYLKTHELGSNESALIIFLPPLHPGSIEPQVRILFREVETPKDAEGHSSSSRQ
jgi:hypothetical protein